MIDPRVTAFLLTAWLVAAILLLPGCSVLPSMKYCDKVAYLREGAQISLYAECQTPIGGVPVL